LDNAEREFRKQLIKEGSQNHQVDSGLDSKLRKKREIRLDTYRKDKIKGKM
ncbi:uncharacterized protein METZ01_LOCUS156427, partial [marine metagenome]